MEACCRDSPLFLFNELLRQPMPATPLEPPLEPMTLDLGRLSELEWLCRLNQEKLDLLVLEGSTADIILGHSLLVKHNLVLSWGTGEVLKWGDECFSGCFPDIALKIKLTSNSLSLCSTCWKPCWSMLSEGAIEITIRFLRVNQCPMERCTPIHPQAKGHRGVHRKGSFTRLHPHSTSPVTSSFFLLMFRWHCWAPTRTHQLHVSFRFVLFAFLSYLYFVGTTMQMAMFTQFMGWIFIMWTFIQ